MYKKILEYYYIGNRPPMLPADSIAYRCRFCGRVLTKDSFQKRAHAVSEGIGNRSIFTSYECDDCNQRFADREENELGELFHLYKALRGKHGKKGTVKMRGGRFSYSEDRTFTAHIDMKTKQFSIVPEFAPNGTLALTYSVKKTINLRLVYRAFIKFALSVVPESISLELEQGYKMLKEDKEFPSYRGSLFLFHEEIPTPCIAVYESDSENAITKYFCTIDIYQIRYIVPLDFNNPIENVPDEIIMSVDCPSNIPYNKCPFDYSDEARTLIQKEQPYHRI